MVSLFLNEHTSFRGRGFAAHPRGFRVNIWNAVQPSFFALLMEFDIPPAMET
jgi:hypothetical protein